MENRVCKCARASGILNAVIGGVMFIPSLILLITMFAEYDPSADSLGGAAASIVSILFGMIGVALVVISILLLVFGIFTIIVSRENFGTPRKKRIILISFTVVDVLFMIVAVVTGVMREQILASIAIVAYLLIIAILKVVDCVKLSKMGNGKLNQSTPEIESTAVQVENVEEKQDAE